MRSSHLLVVEDDKVVSFSLKVLLEEQKYRVDVCSNGNEAWELIKNKNYPLILCDNNLPGLHGKEILKRIKEQGIESELILFTGYGNVRDAVECIKRGAYDYFIKPVDNEKLLVTIQRALEHRALREENRGLKNELGITSHIEIAFRSKKMELLLKKARIAAETDATILITGQSGTGKTLLAKYIHSRSKRAMNHFVEVSCGALSEGLLESELFGHRKGAFTGADRDKKGKFEVASDGTIFLDDINSASLGLQIKLLRVIEEKVFERVGDTKTLHTNARVLAASNRDLMELSAKELFREDLYHRLNVISVEMPGLNERREDIPILVQHFLVKSSRKYKRHVKSIDEAALEVLCKHHWQGNVRELENVIERAVIFCQNSEIKLSDVPEQIASGDNVVLDDKGDLNLTNALERFEQKFILKVLNMHNGNRNKTAEYLGISRATLFNKMRKYGLFQ